MHAARVLAAGAASALIAVAPWSIAMWRTAGSPVYPLFSGHLNTSAMPRYHLSGLADLAAHVGGLLQAGPYIWVTGAVLLGALLARRLLPDAAFVAVAAVASAAVTLVFAINTPFLAWKTFDRYVAAMPASVAVFFVCELLRAADALPQHPTGRAARRARATACLTAAVVLAGVVFSGLGATSPPFTRSALLLERAARDLPPTPPGVELSTPEMRAEYARALRRVAPHHTIAAVDRPYLIDYGRYDIPNLDAPGYMTADGSRFPFFTGPEPKIARLRAAGYRTLLATDPVADLCLNPARIQAALAVQGPVRGVYRRFLDWDHDIQAIARSSSGARCSGLARSSSSISRARSGI